MKIRYGIRVDIRINVNGVRSYNLFVVSYVTYLRWYLLKINTYL